MKVERGLRRSGFACLGAFLFLCTGVLIPALAFAQAVVLDRAQVVARARAHAPAVATAVARVGESRALHVGARALASDNPDLTVRVGPRVTALGETLVDFNVALTWPFDLSGVRAARADLASSATEAAEAEVSDAQRVAEGEAVDLFVRALGAIERVRLATERAALDETLVRSARTRRDAGGGSDLDLALATLLHAESVARARAAAGDREAILVFLRTQVGIASHVPLELTGSLDVEDAPPLETLLARLPRRPDLVHGALAVRAARADARVQTRVGIPLPRLSFQGGRENEYFLQGGVEVPLPIYQRNQTGAAVATARVATRTAERMALLARAETELRAAYASYVGARETIEALRTADAAVDLVERLSTRAYELGQRDLASVVVTRRAAADARAVRLDAVIALARARIAVDQAVGAAQ